MIKIEGTLKYDCLVEGCQGKLYLETEDPLSGDRMLSHFKCMACKASHAYIESLHVLPKEQTPPKNCRFCNQQLDYFVLKDSWSDYYKCDTCKVHYRSSLVDVNTVSEDVFMYARINGRTFCLRQFMPENKSRIDIIPDNPEDTMVVVKGFDILFPNVTPSNIQEKIPIYILFS